MVRGRGLPAPLRGSPGASRTSRGSGSGQTRRVGLQSSPVSAQCSNMNSFFAIVGQPFNQGWGLLKASTWAIAYGLGVQGLLTLIRQAP